MLLVISLCLWTTTPVATRTRLATTAPLATTALLATTPPLATTTPLATTAPLATTTPPYYRLVNTGGHESGWLLFCDAFRYYLPIRRKNSVVLNFIKYIFCLFKKYNEVNKMDLAWPDSPVLEWADSPPPPYLYDQLKDGFFSR